MKASHQASQMIQLILKGLKKVRTSVRYDMLDGFDQARDIIANTVLWEESDDDSASDEETKTRKVTETAYNILATEYTKWTQTSELGFELGMLLGLGLGLRMLAVLDEVDDPNILEESYRVWLRCVLEPIGAERARREQAKGRKTSDA